MFWLIPLFFIGLAFYELAAMAALLLLIGVTLLICMFRKFSDGRVRARPPRCTCRDRGYPRPYHSKSCHKFKGYERIDYLGERDEEERIPEL